MDANLHDFDVFVFHSPVINSKKHKFLIKIITNLLLQRSYLHRKQTNNNNSYFSSLIISIVLLSFMP